MIHFRKCSQWWRGLCVLNCVYETGTKRHFAGSILHLRISVKRGEHTAQVSFCTRLFCHNAVNHCLPLSKSLS